MNPQIKELSEQADLYARSDNSSMLFDVWKKRYTEKFAELIVRECAQVCINLQDIPATEPRHCAEDIKIHFGVE